MKITLKPYDKKTSLKERYENGLCFVCGRMPDVSDYWHLDSLSWPNIHRHLGLSSSMENFKLPRCFDCDRDTQVVTQLEKSLMDK